jgi:hypothetical protein
MQRTYVEDLVWYVAFGSNLSAERFRYYIKGGTPPGSNVELPGARNHQDPIRSQFAQIPHPLSFAYRSQSWGGGTAFIDPRTRTDEPTLGRAYLITDGQLRDVLIQESSAKMPDDEKARLRGLALPTSGFVVLSERKCGGLAVLQAIDDRPAFTITASAPEKLGANALAPAPPYLGFMVDGLRELRVADAAIEAYISKLPLIQGDMVKEALRRPSPSPTTNTVQTIIE